MKIVNVGIIILVIAALGFFVLPHTLQKPQSLPANQPIKIGLVPWIGNGVYYVAQEKGFFQKEKIDIEFVSVDDFATGRQLLQTGRIDAFYLTPESVATLTDTGVKLKIVAANDLSAGADGIIATEEIKDINDLKGKTVAFEIGSPSHFLLSYLLNEQGLTTKDLNVVESIAPDAGVTFVGGKVDAAVTWEPWLSKASERSGGHILASSKDVPVLFDMPIFRAEVVRNRPQDVRAMLRAVFGAEQWIEAHKEDAADIIAGAFKITQGEALEQMQGVQWLSYEDNLNMFTTGKFSVKSSIQMAGDLWLKLGLIKDKVSADEIVDDSLLKHLYDDKTLPKN